MNETLTKYRTILIYLALACAVRMLFWQVRDFGFINYDDPQYVVDNHQVRAGLTRTSVVWAFTSTYTGNWHPLTWLSHMLDCELFGIRPGRHHLTNVLLHIANTLLLFAVFNRMTQMIWPSVFIAGAFALHPLHVESVAWVAERKDLLSTLFWILTMAAHVRYVRHPSFRRYLLILVSFALGLMSKPMLVSLPVVLLLLDYWPLGRLQLHHQDRVGRSGAKSADLTPQKLRLSRLLLEKVPLFMLAAASSTITLVVQQKGGAVKALGMLPLTVRIANALIAYVSYLHKTIWPGGLAIFYPHAGHAVSISKALLAALLLLVVSVLVIWQCRNRRYLLTGWLWYLVTLVPVIGLVQVGDQACADRYTYIPLVGMFVIIGCSANNLVSRYRNHKVILGVSGVVVLSLWSICTDLQLRHWRSSTTVFQHALAVTQDNYLAHYNLAHALIYEEGMVTEGMVQLREVIKIVPGAADPLFMLAWLMATHHGAEYYNPQEAVRLATIACDRTEHRDPRLLDGLGAAYAAGGRFSEAVSVAQQAQDLARSSGKFVMAAEIQERVRLYKSGKPFIERPVQASPQ